jgi:hypothetical protein
LPLLDDVPHRLRRGALHLPIRRSRQNVNLFLRGPLVPYSAHLLELNLMGFQEKNEIGKRIAIVDLADELQIRKQSIFKLLNRLGMKPMQRREENRGNQKAATVKRRIGIESVLCLINRDGECRAANGFSPLRLSEFRIFSEMRRVNIYFYDFFAFRKEAMKCEIEFVVFVFPSH